MGKGKKEGVADPKKAKDTDIVAEATVPAAARTNFPAPLLKVSEELEHRLTEAREALETFDQDELQLPVIRFTNDGFEMSEGDEPVESFTGTILFTKSSNVYFKGRYKAGQTQLPDCASSDGVRPDPDIKEPVHTNCKDCPYNQFGSADDDPDSNGKKCKNTRPVFVLVENAEGETGIMPRVLRVPPTSLPNVKKYLMNVASDYGYPFSIKTKFSVYKKDETQQHLNIKFKMFGKLDPQKKVDAKEILALWKPLMVSGMFGADMVDVTPEEEQAPVTTEQHGDVRF
jgi:hypothetical protein